MSTTPIIYETPLAVRFSDLDPYGHVGAHSYLAFVIAGRWQYAQETLKMTADDFIKRGVGFYMIRSEMDYVRPVVGTQTVITKSHVAEAEGTRLLVPFTIESTPEKGAKIFCKGQLSFAVMDLATMKPQALPDWVRPYFFQ